MRGVARTGAALRSGALRSAALRSAAGRGLDLVAQVGDGAAEAIRVRRDPALAAERRRVAARRRLVLWSLICLLLAALSATGLVDAIGGHPSAASIGLLVLTIGLLLYGLVGVTRAAIDLRARTLLVRRLPAPQPRRRSVAPTIRPLVARLDGYSDALRQVVAGIGLDSTTASAAQMRAVRNETLAAADDAETRLRGLAAELTAIARAGSAGAGARPVGAGARPEGIQEALRREIAAGVEEYGRLVAAAREAAAASRELAASAGLTTAVGQATDQLTALAAGMRELVAQSAGPGSGARPDPAH